jgi:hypothetical protein
MAKLRKERATCACFGVKNECTELQCTVQYNGYKLVGVTTVERCDGSYDSTNLHILDYIHACTQVHTEANRLGLHSYVAMLLFAVFLIQEAPY